MVHSPITGFGTKYRACKEFGLHEFIPNLEAKTKFYIEPFCYSSVVFFNTNCKSAVLNDKNGLIYAFRWCVQNRYDELVKKLEYIWVGELWFNEYKEKAFRSDAQYS